MYFAVTRMISEHLAELHHTLALQRHRRQRDDQRPFILGFQGRNLHFRGSQRNGFVAQLHLTTNLYDGVHGKFGGGRFIDLAEEHALDGAFHVFDGHDGPGVALLGYAPVHIGDQTSQRDLLAFAHRFCSINQMRDGHFTQGRENRLHTGEWMVRHIQAQHFAFEVKLGLLVPFLKIGYGHGSVAHGLRSPILGIGEQIELALRLFALQTHHRVDGGLVHGEQRATVRVNRVEGTGLDQRFDQSPVQRGQGHAADEVHEVHELAARAFAFGDDIGHGLVTHVTDGTKTESDDVADCRVLVHRFVDVRREHLDAHAAGLAQVQCGLVFVGGGTLQQGGHEFDRVVRLQICGPVGDQTVCGGVRFVESVAGERHQNIPHGLGGLFGISVLLHTGEERHLLLGQHFGLLLTHGSTQHVCLAQ